MNGAGKDDRDAAEERERLRLMHERDQLEYARREQGLTIEDCRRITAAAAPGIYDEAMRMVERGRAMRPLWDGLVRTDFASVYGRRNVVYFDDDPMRMSSAVARAALAWATMP